MGRDWIANRAHDLETAVVSPAETAGEPVWRDLDVPRIPSEPERRLLMALADAVDEPLLHDQIATVVVDAVCRCGCSSVRLRSEERPIPGDRVAQLSSRGRDDYFAVEATGSGPDKQIVHVVLHVFNGRVGELEIFDSVNGEGAAIPLTELRGMTNPTVS